MRFATPLRREITLPWLTPVARIGHRGADLYPLAPIPSLPIEPDLTVLDTEFVARSTGELFLYVNDAIGPPGWSGVYYANNTGTATVRVTRKDGAPATPAPQ